MSSESSMAGSRTDGAEAAEARGSRRESVPLTHFFTFYNKLGGVEAFLHHHLSRDRDWGLDSRAVIFFEDSESLPEGVSGLGLNWASTIHGARRRFAASMTELQGRVGLYHNFSGLPFLAGLDGCERRLGLAHSHWPGVEDWMAAQSGLVDGAVCVSESLKALVLERISGLEEDRVVVAPSPITPPEGLPMVRSPLPGRPLEVGVVGRVAREQKRVDRIPELCTAAMGAGMAMRLHVAGDGPDLNWLRREIPESADVALHGRISGAAYWDLLSRLDVILFLSDYEGLPLALLEAMAVGCVPVFPRMGSGGEGYVEKVSPNLLYSHADAGSLLDVLEALAGMSDSDWADARDRAKAGVAAHVGNEYLRTVSEFVHQIRQWPRVSEAGRVRRGLHPGDHCPFAVMSRWAPQWLLR